MVDLPALLVGSAFIVRSVHLETTPIEQAITDSTISSSPSLFIVDHLEQSEHPRGILYFVVRLSVYGCKSFSYPIHRGWKKSRLHVFILYMYFDILQLETIQATLWVSGTILAAKTASVSARMQLMLDDEGGANQLDSCSGDDE